MASLQARHSRKCQLGRPWTSFADAVEGCTCAKGPLYHVVTRQDGRLHREPVGHNRRDAERALRAVQVEIDRGTYLAVENVRFSDWADEWFASLRRPKENTLRGYVSTISYAKRAFGDTFVRQISTADVARFLELMSSASSTTQRKHLRVLHACLKAAMTRKPPLATFNAVAALDPSQLPVKRQLRGSPFTDVELSRLWTKLSEPFLTLCKLALMTGMRQGELIGLSWAAVDLEARVIRVRGAYTQGIGFAEPKSRESAREVILMPEAVDLLRDWRRRQQVLPASTALVFPGAGRDGQIVDSTIRASLYDAMLAAGVPREWRPGHFRSVRARTRSARAESFSRRNSSARRTELASASASKAKRRRNWCCSRVRSSVTLTLRPGARPVSSRFPETVIAYIGR